MLVYELGREVVERLIRVEITHEDLTETVADTDQTLPVYNVKPGELVEIVSYELLEAFEDESDSAFNSTALSGGDGADPDHFLAATQMNANGSAVTHKAGTGTRKMYTAGDTVDLLVESMAAKSLSNIDTGRAVVVLGVFSSKGV